MYYKSLKSAQNEIQEALLKFAYETSVDTSKCSRAEPCQCALMKAQAQTQAQAKPQPEPQPEVVAKPDNMDSRLESIERTLQMFHNKQDAQYEALIGSIQNLNVNLVSLVNLLSQKKDTVETATTIPNLAPQAQGSDLKDVCVTTLMAEQDLETPDDVSAIEGDDTPDIEVESLPQDEEVPEVPEDEDQGVEVEEWTYKGRLFFKDTENTVYANNSGEIGDAIGQYDPVKNVVKKVSTN